MRSNRAVGNPSLHYAVKSDSDRAPRTLRSAGRILLKKRKGQMNARRPYSGVLYGSLVGVSSRRYMYVYQSLGNFGYVYLELTTESALILKIEVVLCIAQASVAYRGRGQFLSYTYLDGSELALLHVPSLVESE